MLTGAISSQIPMLKVLNQHWKPATCFAGTLRIDNTIRVPLGQLVKLRADWQSAPASSTDWRLRFGCPLL
jgi:hypothetical protein